HLPTSFAYSEPCIGGGDLAKMIEGRLVHSCDIETDALTITARDVVYADYIITNPPWSRSILHPMIEHFRMLKPTWLLFDADWMHTQQSVDYMRFCRKVVSVGRLIWIEGTNTSGKDNCCWYLFDKYETKTEFVGR